MQQRWKRAYRALRMVRNKAHLAQFRAFCRQGLNLDPALVERCRA